MKYYLKLTLLLTFLLNFYYVLPSNSADIKKIIDDFTDNPERRWQFYTDQVMGGVSEGRASVRSRGYATVGAAAAASSPKGVPASIQAKIQEARDLA